MHRLSDTLYRWPKEVEPISTPRVALFDLDDTLIVSNRRPKSSTDFEFMPKVIETLSQLAEDSVPVVIITNQGGLAHGNQKILPRLSEVVKSLQSQIPSLILQIYVAAGYDQYRKPMTGIFEKYLAFSFPETRQWSYCGDAAGREGNFSSTDRKFAYNIDLIFQYLQRVAQAKRKLHDPSLQALAELPAFRGTPRSRLSFQVPEECFLLQEDPRPRQWWGFWPAHYLKNLPAEALKETELPDIKEKQAVLLMIGPPGSGKSYMSRQLGNLLDACPVHRDDFSNVTRYLAQARALLQNRQSVILDTTHPSYTSRSFDLASLGNREDLLVYYVHLKTPRNLALHLNYLRAWQELKPVPEIAYHQYYKNYTPPEDDEFIRENPERLITMEWAPRFANLDERFRFLQFTEEGSADRVSTEED